MNYDIWFIVMHVFVVYLPNLWCNKDLCALWMKIMENMQVFVKFWTGFEGTMQFLKKEVILQNFETQSTKSKASRDLHGRAMSPLDDFFSRSVQQKPDSIRRILLGFGVWRRLELVTLQETERNDESAREIIVNT